MQVTAPSPGTDVVPVASQAPDAPQAPTAPQPERPATDPVPRRLRLSWDDGVLRRGRSVEIAYERAGRGLNVLHAETNRRGIGGQVRLDSESTLQGLIADHTAREVARQERALGALQPNVLPGERAPFLRAGQFRLEWLAPNADEPTVYHGLQKAMPEAVRQVMDAVREMENHF